MAAKRLGSFLSNVTGTAGQVLRVNSGETGFEMFTPATIPAYTVTNKTIDRVINADDVTLDEVADVLGTLIDDLSAMGSTGATQQVFESQEYTHTNSNGGTEYTLTHNFGKAPDKTVLYVKNGNGYWYEIQDVIQVDDTNWYGFQVKTTQDSNDTIKIQVFRADGNSTATIKFRCFILGQVAQINPFQWSTSEQVYPFEKADDGSTLYCKQLYVSAMPNGGYVNVAHNIANFNGSKIHRTEGKSYSSNYANYMPIPYVGISANIAIYMDSTNLTLYSSANQSSYSGYVRIYYSK